MATIQYVLFPLLSLGSSTTRLNPKLSTYQIARKINLVGEECANHQYMHKQSNTCTNAIKGLSIPSRSLAKVRSDKDNKINIFGIFYCIDWKIKTAK